MKFTKLDTQTWNRKEVYNRFKTDTPCTYSMTINLDMTNLIGAIKSNNFRFFPTILYGIGYVVNCHSEFRMDIDEHGNIGFYDYSNPYYTIFHSETETFTSIWTKFDPDFMIFQQNYNEDMQEYGSDNKNSKPQTDKNIFNVSCIPWISFTGLNLNLQYGYDYFLPIFTIGKYFADNDKILLPLSMQVHHAVCDGFHASRFVNELQDWADAFSL